MVQDMNCIETLARVDVLCVDKTGTITEARMEAGEPLLLAPDAWPQDRVYTVLHSIYAGTEPDNDTARAMVQRFGKQDATPWPRQSVVPFNSAYKWSAATFAEGSFVVGAPEFVAGARYAELAAQVEPLLEKGSRVLLLARCDAEPDPKVGLDADKLEFVALLPVANRIRPEAPETFRYFEDQGVHVKVISGDTPVTVSEVARQAGIAHAEDYIDASTLKTPEELEEAILKYTVFGRVTPDQKRQFVQALKKNGKTVAMTGDGVNDVLALKDADCSVAMASGSDAAAQAAQLVLLDNDFSKMPSVVLEGRRVVNNLQRSGTLFLVKNIFSFLLSIFSLISMVTYPLEPSQISLISMFTIGIPGFLLSLMPNKNRIEGHFITNILTRALPAALTDFLMVATLVVFGQEFAVGSEDISTAATVLLAIVGFMILYRISKPLNWMRWTILIGSIIAFIFCSTYLNQLFAISDMSRKCIMLLVVFSVATEPVLRYLSILVDSISSFYRKQKIFFLRKREARKAK